MTHSDDDQADVTSNESTPGPGDAKGVLVPNEHAAPGTSEELTAIDGIREHPADPDPEEHNRGGKSF